MKRIICLIIVATLLFTSADTAYAKNNHAGKHDNHETSHYQYNNCQDKKQEFKIDGASVIKYGRYKLPVMPITKGMGATVSFDKHKAVLTVVKNSTTIVINLKNKTVTVNGVKDNNSGIFKAKNSKKMTVLIKYIANLLCANVSFDHDHITVEVPGFNIPSNVLVTPVGTTVIANTLNSTTSYMTATAIIPAGQATGGRAELYVGTKLVATDTDISSNDTVVTFTTSDYTPTTTELQAAIPTGGVVTVKLYDVYNRSTTSAVANPTLVVDYVSPTITGMSSAIYDATNSQLLLTVTGAGAVGDKVDVTKITLYDYLQGKYYQLTNTPGTGSSGVVNSATSLLITIGAADKLGLSSFGSSNMCLYVSPGSLLKDVAGNSSINVTTVLTVSLTATSVGNVIPGLNLPTNVTITPVGTNVTANALNNTTNYLTATANITAGQATGGKAELYVGSKLIATDWTILSDDNVVIFTTSDYTPNNAALQAAIPTGGLVTVKLYNMYNYCVISEVGNPTLVVDYVAPTITGVSSATYDYEKNKLYIVGSGVSKVGDIVDVTKVSLYDTASGKTYQLTNNSFVGSNGTVFNANSILINIGSADRLGLTGFGSTTVSLTIYTGSLLKDAAGNTSTGFTTMQTIPVLAINSNHK